MAERYADILVVDLLGGLGDLLMVLPVVHGLAGRNPGSPVRVLTHEPGADLVRGDPAVAEVRTPRHARPGAEREAVAEALRARTPGLAVTTTRFDGIPELLRGSGARCVTDLWRRPPPDELVTTRYLRILHDEGLLDAADLRRRPRVHLSVRERAAGERLLATRWCAAAGRPPLVLVTDAGMAVKRWPRRHWRRLAGILAAHGHPPLAVTPGLPAATLPRCGLRRLAAVFAAVGAAGGAVIGCDTGPLRLAAAAGAPTVALFGPTLAARYGLGSGNGAQLQGLPGCPHRRPAAITEQVCWWTGRCPLRHEPACMAQIDPAEVARAALRLVGG